MISNTEYDIFVSASLLTRKKKISQLLSGCYCEKIPDPKNSYIFREAKCQVSIFLTQINMINAMNVLFQ